MDGTVALSMEGLSKRYREVLAVDKLSLTVPQGQIYGFLGRNGAGKTTTIRMLLGLIQPSAGRVVLNGHPVAGERSQAVAGTGCLVESATAYPNLTVRENLRMHCSLLRQPPAAADEAMEMAGIAELAGRRAGQLSLGNKQRLALARAFVGKPRLLVLDEPANALDPAGIVEIRQLLRTMARERGTTMFISSHILSEIALLADRIGIIHRGRLVDEFDTAATGTQTVVTLRASEPARVLALVQERWPRIAAVVRTDGSLELGPSPEGTPPPADLARLVVQAGLDLHALESRGEDLEERFMRLTGGEA